LLQRRGTFYFARSRLLKHLPRRGGTLCRGTAPLKEAVKSLGKALKQAGSRSTRLGLERPIKILERGLHVINRNRDA
jgi:hypothetical protein